MVASLAAATVVIFCFTNAVNETPSWTSDYGKALQATRADDRPLLVVLDVPADPESRIEPALLCHEQTQTETDHVELLRPYQLCHVDVTTDYGKKVARAFGAKAFPHTAIIDKTGSVIIYAKSGKLADNEWKTTLTSHKTGDRPTTSLISFESTSEARPYCASCQRGF